MSKIRVKNYFFKGIFEFQIAGRSTFSNGEFTFDSGLNTWRANCLMSSFWNIFILPKASWYLHAISNFSAFCNYGLFSFLLWVFLVNMPFKIVQKIISNIIQNIIQLNNRMLTSFWNSIISKNFNVKWQNSRFFLSLNLKLSKICCQLEAIQIIVIKGREMTDKNQSARYGLGYTYLLPYIIYVTSYTIINIVKYIIYYKNVYSGKMKLINLQLKELKDVHFIHFDLKADSRWKYYTLTVQPMLKEPLKFVINFSLNKEIKKFNLNA